MMYLDNGNLDLDIPDDYVCDRIQEIFDRTGAITAGWGQYEGGEPVEFKAQPRTPEWLWFVVANILYPMGHRADFGVTEDDASGSS